MMIKILCIILMGPMLVFGQIANSKDLEKGINFIRVPTYSQEENEQILKLYEGLRVADVSDGMDRVGLQNVGLVNPQIRAAWKDLETLKHQFRGIALTVRYVPSNLSNRPEANKDFDSWLSNFYTSYSSEAFISIIKSGHVVVIDDVEDADIGSIGSFNILSWYASGAVGVVTDARARDTDEIVLEQVPLYFRGEGRGERPGRNMLESVNRPVSIGGVLVCPGDVVVADGDGVIVVPRRVAESVAIHARKILENDKKARRNLYEKLGLKLDRSVK